MPIGGDLPAHLTGTRTSMTGPATGGYFALTCQTLGDASTGGDTDLAVGTVVIPCDCRIMAITFGNTASAGGASRATFQVTDGTNDLITADTACTTATGTTVTGSGTGGLVEAQRDRSQNDVLECFVTTVASEDLNDPCFTILCYAKQHPSSDPADD